MDTYHDNEDTDPPSYTATEKRKGTQMRRITYLNPWKKETKKNTHDANEDNFHTPWGFREKEPQILYQTNRENMMNTSTCTKRSIGRHMGEFILIRPKE